jgi:hypothetical protein
MWSKDRIELRCYECGYNVAFTAVWPRPFLNTISFHSHLQGNCYPNKHYRLRKKVSNQNKI